LAAPALAASDTDLSAARMFFSVSSRPCSACQRGVGTALRSCSPCLGGGGLELGDQGVGIEHRLGHAA
jgi:hypothetical protein